MSQSIETHSHRHVTRRTALIGGSALFAAMVTSAVAQDGTPVSEDGSGDPAFLFVQLADS